MIPNDRFFPSIPGILSLQSFPSNLVPLICGEHLKLEPDSLLSYMDITSLGKQFLGLPTSFIPPLYVTVLHG